jgi:hypothetical protein
MKFDEIFKGQPSDPIEFLYRENFITVSSIGSIFTFGLISNFQKSVFDKIMAYVLPPESFGFMKVTFPDIGLSKPLQPDPNDPTTLIALDDPHTIYFGNFVRETIIWIFMILLLYILAIFVRWPTYGGLTFSYLPRF